MKRAMVRLFSVVSILAAVTATGSVALAAWGSAGAGNAGAEAVSLPSGSTPSTNVANRTVTVSWSAVTLPGGAPVDGYRLSRYDAGGASVPASGTCAGLVTTLDCTETAVAPGTWSYSVAPVHSSWVGAEGTRSPGAVVAAPALTLSGSTNLTTLPGALDGTVENYVPGQSLTMRLDDPVTGAVLVSTVTPASIPASGSASIQVTVPNSVADGGHMLYAVGSGGEISSAPFTVAAPTPSPTSLSTTNGDGGGGARKLGVGDTIAITFSSPLQVASLCSTWTGDGVNQSAAATVQVDDDAAAGNDRLRLTTTAPVCGGAYKFGQIDLGSNGFVNANATFMASIAWDAAQRQLTITVLGDSPAAKKVNSSTTLVYAPDAAITGTSGRAVTGTASATATHF